MKDKKLKEITTDKQLNSIRFIESKLDIKFKGKTKEDASEFIGEYLPQARYIASRYKVPQPKQLIRDAVRDSYIGTYYDHDLDW